MVIDAVNARFRYADPITGTKFRRNAACS